MYTDANSISDNSWRISHAASSSTGGDEGLEIHRESVGSGNLGYGAVVIDTICVDKAKSSAINTSSPSLTFVESCYDIELFDANGDGLTSSWGAVEGISGGFSLSLDGSDILEHRSQACLMGDDQSWNECAATNGFEYCGLRVCTTASGAEVSGSATVSNLSGSQCSVFQPQCLSGVSSSSSSTSSPLSSSSILVQVETDSFADELSWEVRVSSKSDPISIKRAFENELLLAGGKPFYQEGTDSSSSNNILMGQPGVGVPLQDHETYNSTACLPDHQSVKCYDFRAYDKYGDGLGCGADGSLSIVLETAVSADRREKLTVAQEDKNMAKRQEVDGEKKLACMDESRLSKWNYCAVRVCTDGALIALEGNQCDFGMGEDLIDSRFSDIDPLSGLTMRPRQDELPKDEEVIKLEDAMPEPIDVEDLNFDVTEEFIVKDVEKVERVDDPDETWAEYYEALEPGLRGDPQAAFAQPDQDKPNQDKPNQDSIPDEDTPAKMHGVKGPRKGKDRPQEKTDLLTNDGDDEVDDNHLVDDEDDNDDKSKKLTKIQKMKIKKQRERQKKNKQKQKSDETQNQDESESSNMEVSSSKHKKERESDESVVDLNIMGYLSSSQIKKERRDNDEADDKVYKIMDVDIYVQVDNDDR